MASQGKCPQCRVRYVFRPPSPYPLHHLGCPRCGGFLARTSHLSKLPVEVCQPEFHHSQGAITPQEVSRE